MGDEPTTTDVRTHWELLLEEREVSADLRRKVDALTVACNLLLPMVYPGQEGVEMARQIVQEHGSQTAP